MRDFIVEFSMSVSRWRGAGATRKVGWGGLVWGLPHSTLLAVVRGWGLAFSLICYYDGWTRAQCHILRSDTARVCIWLCLVACSQLYALCAR